MTPTSTIQPGQTAERGTVLLPIGARIVTVYPASDGHRWRLRYQHNILSDSGQAYAAKQSALDAARKNGVPAGDFPVILEYDRRRGSSSTPVWERIR
ncbi:uncharacterized protein RMCC_5728 [Mycolicibacterium canariasense]|uniref:Uncharacterized protein n=1 Tax=Mycolicibacterium canariasense TaxID=228230 RepID=A0A124E339_MYCCR|nr:hypothetical protein [Mycolicibacterium canariasense]MCV7208339.1 hypothetical protein [Mycolicibacterium canariasense]ORV13527.1 hypothetical protein AWB94_04705 [Mycolicibacterium canariasense]GAS98763.1 uncharacterized protein RMCC_5728 [Mycolicibacterium canariasense]